MKKNPGRKEMRNRMRKNRKAEGRKKMIINEFAQKRVKQGHPIQKEG